MLLGLIKHSMPVVPGKTFAVEISYSPPPLAWRTP
jgi:hypothetical protein